jgi:hypothetical protein
MKAHPILFNGAMVRALLDGSKTQTRRAIKPQPDFVGAMGNPHVPWKTKAPGLHVFLTCPYGQPGDRLWVKETWRTDASLDDKAPSTFNGWPVKYDADGKVLRHGAFYGDTKGKTRSSLFMPRWASRILLEVVSVRVERLQAISEADCRAEGAAGGHGAIPGYGYSATPIEHYHHVWGSINGAGSWDANPWVWVIEFKRVAS